MQEPTPTLRAVVYVSVSTRRMTRDALEHLLVDARERNRASGVTGVLLCSEDQFMQYFEGPPTAVQVTYDRIRASRGHACMTEMMDEPITIRQFPGWEMALVQPTRSDMVALSTAAWVAQDTISVARGHRSIGMALLRDFWLRERGRR